MIHNCPICNSPLIEEEVYPAQLGDKDFICRKENHFLAKRVKSTGETSILKFRLKEGNEKLFIKLNYKSNHTSIWTKPNEVRPIRVPGLIALDLSNIHKLKQKIKTYLLFS